MSCGNNLRQTGLIMQQHHDALRSSSVPRLCIPRSGFDGTNVPRIVLSISHACVIVCFQSSASRPEMRSTKGSLMEWNGMKPHFLVARTGKTAKREKAAPSEKRKIARVSVDPCQ
jgi:hypothetical protein